MDKGDLSELNTIFKDMGGVKKVDEYANTYEELPDGTYIGEIENVIATNSKNTGRPMIDITIALEGKRKDHVRLMLAGKDLKATQTAIARTIKQLQKLGLTGETPEDFINAAETSLTGLKVNLKVETTGTFTNKSLTLA